MSASTTRRSEVVKVSPPGAGGPWQGVDSAVSVACVAPLDLCPGQASPDAEVDLAQAAVMPSLDQDQVALFPVAGRCRSFTGLAFYTFAGTQMLARYETRA